jgi:hypothetical protein
VGIQEGLDIDVLVHGEAERTDMSEHFGGWRVGPGRLGAKSRGVGAVGIPLGRRSPPAALGCTRPMLLLTFLPPRPPPTPPAHLPRLQTGMQLSGMVFTQHGWVQSYGSRYVRPPIIAGDVTFVEPMTVREFKVAQVRRGRGRVGV